MSEISVPPIKLLHKDVIKRELSPIYACTTIKQAEPAIGAVYQRVMSEILGKKRKTMFSYMDGFTISGEDITPKEKIEVLKILAKQLKQKGIRFSSLYVDMLGKNDVNLGLYFDSEEELKKIAETYKDDLRFSFIADMEADGRYTIRGNKDRCVGHETYMPHLKGDMAT